MLRGLIRAALTAILIPIASTFALAQAPGAVGAAGDPVRNDALHYLPVAGASVRGHGVSRGDQIFQEPLMKYMMMMNAPRGGGDWQVTSWPPEDLKAHINFMIGFAQDLKDQGVLVGAEGLSSPEEARIVRAGRDGTPQVTDGPFAEAKEFLAGYWIVEVDSPERAYEIAARASAAPGRGGVPLNMPIEVRQVMSAPTK
jgi:hypothetical protein